MKFTHLPIFIIRIANQMGAVPFISGNMNADVNVIKTAIQIKIPVAYINVCNKTKFSMF